MSFKAACLCATLMATATSAFALPATVEDLTLRSDITSTTYLFDLGMIDTLASARLRADVGMWNSNGGNPLSGPAVIVGVTVNGAALTSIGISDGIFGFNHNLDETFFGLLTDGVNEITFTKTSDFTDGAPATFATDDVTIDYETASAAVPLPASALMLLAGFGGLAAFRRRTA